MVRINNTANPLYLLIILFHVGYFIDYFNTTNKADEVKSIVTDPYSMINEGQGLLKEGDLVVRLNADPASVLIKNFNRQDKSFSHAGIVLFDDHHPFVYHIVHSEETLNMKSDLKKESLIDFSDPKKNYAYGIFRYHLSEDELGRMKKVIKEWYAKGLSFDLQFDMRTDNKMYCAEMIKKALSKATYERVKIETTKPTTEEVQLFCNYMKTSLTNTNDLEIVSIDNLYNSTSCSAIKKYSFNEQ